MAQAELREEDEFNKINKSIAEKFALAATKDDWKALNLRMD